MLGDNDQPWLLLSDDRYQQLSLTRIADNGSSDLVAGWPVYDDQVYPYGDNSYDEANFSREPQEIHTGDLNGDGRKELIMICHNRALLYLSAHFNNTQQKQNKDAIDTAQEGDEQ